MATEQPFLFTALAGVWRGAGTGEYPTMETFAYEEEVRFTDIGAPFLHYFQRGRVPGTAELLHSETGIWRAYADGRVALTVALPRVAEVSEGRYDDGVIALDSSSIRRAEGGAALVEVHRQYTLDGDRLDYEIAMATEGVPDPVRHLTGSLVKVQDAPMAEVPLPTW